MVKYCDDPLKRHKFRINKNLRTISDNLYEKLGGKLSKETLLCNNCRTKLANNPKSLDIILSESESTASIRTVESVGFEDGGHSEIDDVLNTLDVSPIKSRKLIHISLKNSMCYTFINTTLKMIKFYFYILLQMH